MSFTGFIHEITAWFKTMHTKSSTPLSPDVIEARLVTENLERELVFGMMRSYAFYRDLRDTICVWDPTRYTHRGDFENDRYNTLYRAIDSFYRRFDNVTVEDTNFGLPNSVLSNTIVTWSNRNGISESVAVQLLNEIKEETEFTQSLTYESLRALSNSDAFKDWL